MAPIRIHARQPDVTEVDQSFPSVSVYLLAALIRLTWHMLALIGLIHVLFG